MVYIAGLNVYEILCRSPVSHAQGVESVVWLTTFAGVYRGFRNHAKGHRHRLHAKHGLPQTNLDTGIPQAPGANIGVKPPTPFLVKFLSPVVHAAIIVTPTVYLVSTAWGSMEQPEWFSNWALPDLDLEVGPFATLRTLACVANYGLLYILKRTRQQIHAASTPEKPSIPQEGPYSFVRHPMAAATLLGQVTYALMWWNTIPLAAAATTAVYLTFQLPHEEHVKETDLLTGTQYSEYKKRVTSRLIPYVW
ncbi:uncharacterized protein PHACADRAFT_164835 [Phanerochaete carnosa HHB-10118-sp]|uniref:Protein-S-isoprenylcysteine O-methyltransferase n=1 Tax=Phanerochaete carnosa (strain HHB-10118-sp) TaxID=650164 RepID=K5VY16_PHACS|nr:uncharacterized protein PHACADRAFT_164835 [Phanerochaete carnosa HHB-10118-sp]EKM51489.1 hypothetical protein PHACADRAFT_164835 [Phanerochaete carnosa HHB-10118-sp]